VVIGQIIASNNLLDATPTASAFRNLGFSEGLTNFLINVNNNLNSETGNPGQAVQNAYQHLGNS
jgi:hypothetical protein